MKKERKRRKKNGRNSHLINRNISEVTISKGAADNNCVHLLEIRQAYSFKKFLKNFFLKINVIFHGKNFIVQMYKVHLLIRMSFMP